MPRLEGLTRSRRADLTAVALLLACATVYVLTAARLESYGSDTSTYFELAHSLLHQHRYWFDFEPHTIYPPGYPVLLAGLMMLGGETFSALVRLSVPIYFLGLLGLYWYVKLRRGPGTALVVLLLGAVSTVGYFWTTVGLHSDVPYFTISVWALLLMELAGRATPGGRRAALLALAAVGAAYLVMVRSIGVTLVGGLLLWIVYPGAGQARPAGSLVARAKTWLPVAFLPLLVLAAWMRWSAEHAPPPGMRDYMQSYTTQIVKSDPHQIDSPNITLVELPGRTVRMLRTRAVAATRTVLNLPVYLSGYNPVTLAFLLVVGVGYIVSLSRERTVLDWYLLCYGGLLLLYPFDEGTRYLFPVQSFLALYAIDGVGILRRYGRRAGDARGGIVAATAGNERLLGAGMGVLVAGVLAAGGYGIWQQARQNLHPDPSQFVNARTVEVAAWVRQNTRPGDVIMNDQFAILHRLTGRRTVRFPLFTDPAVITDRLVGDSVDFVVVLKERPFEYYNPSTARRFETVLALHPGLFTPVYVFDQGTVYAVHREMVADHPARTPS